MHERGGKKIVQKQEQKNGIVNERDQNRSR